MSLNELTKLVCKKRAEIENLISHKAEEIKLQDVIDEIVIQPYYLDGRKLKYGQKLNFALKSEEYIISVEPQQLVLKDFQGTEIKTFYSSEIRKLYDSLLSEMQKESRFEVVR